MKRSFAKKLAGAALIAGTLGLAGLGVASAHEGHEGRGGRGGPGFGGPRRAEMLQRFDKNGDGQLDDVERAEARAAFAEKHAEMLQRFDTNKDGQLDETERAAMRSARAAERFAALDTNHDGVLSLAEFQAGAAQGGFHRGGPR